MNVHRKHGARDASEKNAQRSHQIVSQKQQAIGKERNFTSQENRKRDTMNTSILAPTKAARDPLSAQKAKPLYQVRQRELVARESLIAKKQLQSLTVHDNGQVHSTEEPQNMYQNTSLPDIHASQSTNKSLVLRSSKNSSHRNRQALSKMVYGGVYENPMTRKSHGAAVIQSHDFSAQDQLAESDFNLPFLSNKNNRLVHPDIGSGGSLPRVPHATGGHLSQKSI